MVCKVRLKGSDVDFLAERGESLLDAAIRAGLNVDYGCNSGNCGRCSATLIEGEVKKIRHYDYPQSAIARQRGDFLMCCHEAIADLVLEVRMDEQYELIPEQGFSAKVKKINRINDNVRVVALRPPRSLRLRFLAGQYALLSGARFDKEQCSIASCPCEQQRVEFHVPRRHDAFSSYVFESCRVGDRINVTAPFGSFVFSEDFSRPALFFAFETGFAAIKSLIEHVTGQEEETELRLCWITTGGKPYLHNLCRSWADAFDGFVYEYLVVNANDTQADSRADPRADPQADPRALQSCVQNMLERQPELTTSDAYLCVPKSVGEVLAEVCIRYGFDSSRLFYEPVRGGVC